MRDARADHRLGAAAQLSGHQVAAKRKVRRDLLGHHPPRLLHRLRPALRQTADPHRDYYIGFSGKRPGIHADVEPIGVFRYCGHVLTLNPAPTNVTRRMQRAGEYLRCVEGLAAMCQLRRYRTCHGDLSRRFIASAKQNARNKGCEM